MLENRSATDVIKSRKGDGEISFNNKYYEEKSISEMFSKAKN